MSSSAARRAPVALVFVLLALTVLPEPAGAHTGHSCGIGPVIEDVARLQAECFSDGDAACDPDAHGEHTQIYTGALPPGADGELVMAPRSGCSIVWEDVLFVHAAEITSFRVFRNNALVMIRVDFYIDGALVARGSYAGVTGGGYATVATTDRVVFPPGLHDVRARYTVTFGDMAQNLFFDHVEALVLCDRPPRLHFANANWMPGNVSWRDLAYDFYASASDPDGDGMRFDWSFGDGGAAIGASARHAFTASGEHVVTLLVREVRPSERCPDAPELSISQDLPAYVIDPSMARLESPTQGTSCAQDVRVTAQFAPGIYAGTCTLAARFDADRAPVGAALFTVNGRLLASDTAAPYRATFRSVDHAAGPGDWLACFVMIGDIHARPACPAPVRFVNVGLLGPG